MRKVEVGMIVSWLTSVLVGMNIFGSAASAQVESTGFEAIDGWVAGYSICGPEFAATCSYPITNVCVPHDHAASQNCCESDPNEHTGWYMADDSQHCNEPHIDTVNPFSGLQHLRLAQDPAVVDAATAHTPRLAVQTPTRTVISVQIAGSNREGSSLRFLVSADDDPFGRIAADVLFRDDGRLSVYDFLWDDYHLRNVVWDAGSVYRNFTIDLDPARNIVRYCYHGRFVCASGLGSTQARSVQGAVFQSDSAGAVWDVDDYSVTRGGPAPTTCAVFATACRPGPCASLVAVGINGEPIPLTRDVHVRPGDLLETEIRFSGWPELVHGVRLYQAKLDILTGSVTGPSGTVLPVGWCAPPGVIPCIQSSECPADYPICITAPLAYGCTCAGHNPSLGAFITTDRSDFFFFGFPGFFPIDVRFSRFTLLHTA